MKTPRTQPNPEACLRVRIFVEALKQAAALLPDDRVVAEHLGDALLRQGQIEEARKQYRRALTLEPGNLDLQQKIDALEKKP